MLSHIESREKWQFCFIYTHIYIHVFFPYCLFLCVLLKWWHTHCFATCFLVYLGDFSTLLPEEHSYSYSFFLCACCMVWHCIWTYLNSLNQSPIGGYLGCWKYSFLFIPPFLLPSFSLSSFLPPLILSSFLLLLFLSTSYTCQEQGKCCKHSCICFLNELIIISGNIQ